MGKIFGSLSGTETLVNNFSKLFIGKINESNSELGAKFLIRHSRFAQSN